VEELIVEAVAKEVQRKLESGVSGAYGDGEVELPVISQGGRDRLICPALILMTYLPDSQYLDCPRGGAALS